MPIVRLIFVTVGRDDAQAAEQVWKEDCAPLMIKQKGCLSEAMLKSRDMPGEFISYSVWDTQENIERYEASADHQEIKRHAAGLKAERPPVVKLYEQV